METVVSDYIGQKQAPSFEIYNKIQPIFYGRKKYAIVTGIERFSSCVPVGKNLEEDVVLGYLVTGDMASARAKGTDPHTVFRIGFPIVPGIRATRVPVLLGTDYEEVDSIVQMIPEIRSRVAGIREIFKGAAWFYTPRSTMYGIAKALVEYNLMRAMLDSTSDSTYITGEIWHKWLAD